MAFERAESSDNEKEKRRPLTTVVIGGGPTGVKMPGAISELGRFMIARDFRDIRADQLQVLLIKAGPRILSTFPENLSRYTAERLMRIGADIRLNANGRARPGKRGADRRPLSASELHCLGCGVKTANWLGVSPSLGGRLQVASDLSVSAKPGIYAIGDTELALDKDDKPLPSPASGQAAGPISRPGAPKANLFRSEPIPTLHFHNRANAVIGRHAGIFDFGSCQLKG